MACYHPVEGYLSRVRNASGKRSVVFSVEEGFIDKPVSVPCGRCIGCRLEYARQWAVRCMHEASLYERNCFVTLTYEDKYLPPDGGLCPRDMVLFLKRLRKRYDYPIRYFQCGEYGERLGRPHHHVLLFNHDFADKVALNNVFGERNVWRSKELEELWPFGRSEIGTVTFESAGYVARYSMKKVTGAAAADWYMGRHPEYLTMSRRPGIGYGWLMKFAADVYPDDMLIVNGVRCKPPRFYDEMLAKRFPKLMAELKRKRARAAVDSPDNTGKRLLDREAVQVSRVKFLPRSLEVS